MLVVKNLSAKTGDIRNEVRSLSQEDPLEENMVTHSSIPAGESHGQTSLVGYSPWGHKESDTTEATCMHARCVLILYPVSFYKLIQFQPIF